MIASGGFVFYVCGDFERVNIPFQKKSLLI